MFLSQKANDTKVITYIFFPFAKIRIPKNISPENPL